MALISNIVNPNQSPLSGKDCRSDVVRKVEAGLGAGLLGARSEAEVVKGRGGVKATNAGQEQGIDDLTPGTRFLFLRVDRRLSVN